MTATRWKRLAQTLTDAGHHATVDTRTSNETGSARPAPGTSRSITLRGGDHTIRITDTWQRDNWNGWSAHLQAPDGTVIAHRDRMKMRAIVLDAINDLTALAPNWPDPHPTITIQWAPTGNTLDGAPGPILQLLATNNTTHGYAPGPDQSMTFGTEHGDIDLRPTQWVTRHPDGTITVTDTKPTPTA